MSNRIDIDLKKISVKWGTVTNGERASSRTGTTNYRSP